LPAGVARPAKLLSSSFRDRERRKPHPKLMPAILRLDSAFGRAGFRATLLLGILFSSVSCREAKSPVPAQTGRAVAVVAGAEITVEMVQAELARQFHRVAAADLTPAQKQAALETLIQTEALYAKAKAAGFDRTPEMEARVKNLIVNQFREARFPVATATLPELEIEQYYRANQSRYALPAAVRGAMIFLKAPANATPEKQDEFQHRAATVWAEAKAAETDSEFADVVRRHSEDQATRYRGGDIGWLNPGDARNPALTEALFAVEKPGAVAPLIQTSGGYFIAKVTERKEAGFKPLAEVSEAIRYQLIRQQTQQAEGDFRAAIRQGLSIQINQSLLDSITVPEEKVAPPRTPGTRPGSIRE
jgi:peptidyl-prolyl cis-trans isomerase C